MKRKNILCISGTDTEIGKTTIASLLISELAAREVKLAVMKPVQTECVELESGELYPNDAVKLWEAAGKTQPLEDIILYRYCSPVAPVVAAKVEGRPIDYSAIVRAIEDQARASELLIFEGTGGILVPLTETKTFVDLMQDVGAETVVVVGSRLGAMNHASLTFRVLRNEKIPCLGYVFNDLFAKEPVRFEREDRVDAISTNRKLLRDIAGGYGLSELAAVPYLPNWEVGKPFVSGFADVVMNVFGVRGTSVG